MYIVNWRYYTRSSRSLVSITKGTIVKPSKVIDKDARRAEIMAELDTLGYKLPGVN